MSYVRSSVHCCFFLLFFVCHFFFFFFFNDTATTEIYTLSLHDALPISLITSSPYRAGAAITLRTFSCSVARVTSPKRSEEHTSELSHLGISYAVFCLKKKKKKKNHLSINKDYHNSINTVDRYD